MNPGTTAAAVPAAEPGRAWAVAASMRAMASNMSTGDTMDLELKAIACGHPPTASKTE